MSDTYWQGLSIFAVVRILLAAFLGWEITHATVSFLFLYAFVTFAIDLARAPR